MSNKWDELLGLLQKKKDEDSSIYYFALACIHEYAIDNDDTELKNKVEIFIKNNKNAKQESTECNTK